MYSQMKKVTLKKIDAENVRKKIFIGDDSMALVKHDYPILEYTIPHQKQSFSREMGKSTSLKKPYLHFWGMKWKSMHMPTVEYR